MPSEISSNYHCKLNIINTKSRTLGLNSKCEPVYGSTVSYDSNNLNVKDLFDKLLVPRTSLLQIRRFST